MNTENTISKDKNMLLVLSNEENNNNELQYLIGNFCGKVIKNLSEINEELKENLRKKKVYVCGNIAKLEYLNFPLNIPLFIIKEFSSNVENLKQETYQKNIHQYITLGKVPIVISNAGVYFREFFEDDDYFHKIKSEHEFQDLTESSKLGIAFRKGIYLTKVSKEITETQQEILRYHLLRCSSNFSGATDNFRKTDMSIINAMNDATKYIFEQETTLNHVLAQIYENKQGTETSPKEKKAKIKAHSDKTKDMPKNALIAFCTFYDKSNFQQLKPSKTDKYDWCYKDISALTKLHFKLKNSVNDDTLAKEFTVILYPNSVFFISLATNRLYTHEIKPSTLNVMHIPTRLGYVVRCSNKEAIFMDNQTYIIENNTLIPLESINIENENDLRESYRQENETENQIEYGKIDFSMNLGDYQKPIY